MLRRHDILLTFAAVSLVIASQNLSRKVYQATADQIPQTHSQALNSSSQQNLLNLDVDKFEANQLEASESPGIRAGAIAETVWSRPRSAKDYESMGTKADIQVAEQQQPTPFVLFPFNQLQNPPLQVDPLGSTRQVPLNYQGFQNRHSSPKMNNPLIDTARQSQLAQLDGSRAPLTNNVQSLQQQPLSPLQILTGPIQAMLNPLNPSDNRARHGSSTGNQLGQAQADRGLNPTTQRSNQHRGILSSVLTPNNQPQQPPNLQSLYQQLPLYQSLLAARQRHEAIEAERQRQQQLSQQQPPRLLGNSHGRPSTNPLQGWPAPREPSPEQQTRKPSGPPLSGQHAGRAHSGSNSVDGSHTTTPPSSSQVDFDDEKSRRGQHGNQLDEPASEEQADDQGGEQPENQSNANNEAEHGEGQPEGQQGGNDEQGGQNDGDNSAGNGANGSGGAGWRPEEEDPDLKQFQNFANGGDSFSDLFPADILGNNDKSNEKKKSDEESKRQEEEERRKQLQNQHQGLNHNHGQPTVQPQTPTQHERPIEEKKQQPNKQENEVEQDEGQPENEENNSSNNEEPEPESENDQGEGENDTDGNETEEENPTAAALTAKSKTDEKPSRYSESPGVEYDNSKA